MLSMDRASDLTDWRDVFCGRSAELDDLVRLFEEVRAGKGPRLAVVLGDRGMGKTRLVQELYRVLAARHDPQDYWPDAALFAGNNLRVAPDLSDARIAAHYRSFRLEERPMPFLWWGFRVADPALRNASRADMAVHRSTLNPHLGPIFFARRLAAARERLKAAGHDAATEFGKDLLKKTIKAIPGIGFAVDALELAVDYAGKGQDAAIALREEHRLKAEQRDMGLLDVEAERAKDILDSTLEDLAGVLAPGSDLSPLPTVVFCDDAQFARSGGDEGALRLLQTLWQRAHLADWPLMLVLTHWEFEWHQDAAARPSGKAFATSCAAAFGRDARSVQFSSMIELSRETELARLVLAGLPGLPLDDVARLTGKADGNPQALIELVLSLIHI